jgi:hypothetical protein
LQGVDPFTCPNRQLAGFEGSNRQAPEAWPQDQESEAVILQECTVTPFNNGQNSTKREALVRKIQSRCQR